MTAYLLIYILNFSGFSKMKKKSSNFIFGRHRPRLILFPPINRKKQKKYSKIIIIILVILKKTEYIFQFCLLEFSQLHIPLKLRKFWSRNWRAFHLLTNCWLKSRLELRHFKIKSHFLHHTSPLVQKSSGLKTGVLSRL